MALVSPHRRRVMVTTATGPSTGPTESAVDAAMVSRVARGGQAALGEFYDRFSRQVYSLARRICADPEIADEVTQDVFLSLWRTADRFDPTRGSVASWVMTVAHHRAVDAVRREATVRRHTRPAGDDDRELPVGPGADRAAVAAVVAGQVREALSGLRPAHRQVLTLAYFGGYTQSETALMLGIPVGTVKSRTFQALIALRGRLRPLDLGRELS